MLLGYHLVLQSFGGDFEYRRALLTVYSFFSALGHTRHKVILYTDNPDWFYGWLVDLPIIYELLTPERMRQMRGSIDFLHRMKIAEIEHAFNLSGTNILYADSDTFFMLNPDCLMKELDDTTAFMHLHEYKFSEADYFWNGAYGKTMNAFLEIIKSQHFKDASGVSFPISMNDSSWNAGVMMLHHSHARLLPDVYSLTDQIFPPTRNHASEQYAFSLVLQRSTTLKPCDSAIYHYWYKAKKQICDDLLNRTLSISFKRLSLEDKLNQVRDLVYLLPNLFQTHPIMIRDHATQAFNEGNKLKGYRWSVRLLFNSPLMFFSFLRDIAYFTFKKGLIQNG